MSTERHSDVAGAAQQLGDAVLALGATRPDLAVGIAALATAVAAEAARTPRFANAIQAAFTQPAEASTGQPRARRPARRAPGPIDPFAVYADGGESRLREQLLALELEQLRDIVAQHGMDHDRLAMKWKDSSRVVDRIVEKVTSRVAKGSAFRDA
ncbi:hypothetical protein ACT17Q_15450 [Cellulomonas sp. CW35]|uniref:hypothetical protein n=1 Tax=Cellulomonas sp. CW35 TaxID=3458249 RepID=UPI004033E50F